VWQPTPAKVLAYRFYQDAARAAELVARNDPPSPAFMANLLETLAY
jgi:prophage DNA circulation protein